MTLDGIQSFSKFSKKATAVLSVTLPPQVTGILISH